MRTNILALFVVFLMMTSVSVHAVPYVTELPDTGSAIGYTNEIGDFLTSTGEIQGPTSFWESLWGTAKNTLGTFNSIRQEIAKYIPYFSPSSSFGQCPILNFIKTGSLSLGGFTFSPDNVGGFNVGYRDNMFGLGYSTQAGFNGFTSGFGGFGYNQEGFFTNLKNSGGTIFDQNGLRKIAPNDPSLAAFGQYGFDSFYSSAIKSIANNFEFKQATDGIWKWISNSDGITMDNFNFGYQPTPGIKPGFAADPYVGVQQSGAKFQFMDYLQQAIKLDIQDVNQKLPPGVISEDVKKIDLIGTLIRGGIATAKASSAPQSLGASDYAALERTLTNETPSKILNLLGGMSPEYRPTNLPSNIINTCTGVCIIGAGCGNKGTAPGACPLGEPSQTCCYPDSSQGYGSADICNAKPNGICVNARVSCGSANTDTSLCGYGYKCCYTDAGQVTITPPIIIRAPNNCDAITTDSQKSSCETCINPGQDKTAGQWCIPSGSSTGQCQSIGYTC
ncbi:MAG: hypothetical protein ABIG30_01925 [Candidatus Aenigmatarchaeota archaeon]